MKKVFVSVRDLDALTVRHRFSVLIQCADKQKGSMLNRWIKLAVFQKILDGLVNVVRNRAHSNVSQYEKILILVAIIKVDVKVRLD